MDILAPEFVFLYIWLHHAMKVTKIGCEFSKYWLNLNLQWVCLFLVLMIIVPICEIYLTISTCFFIRQAYLNILIRDLSLDAFLGFKIREKFNSGTQ